MAEAARLDFLAAEFPVEARSHITTRERFVFRLEGDARRQMDRDVVDGALRDPLAVSVRLRLRDLAFVIVFAETQGQPVRFEVTDEYVDVHVG